MPITAADKLDSANETGLYSELTVGTTAVEVKVGASALENRKVVHMLAKDNSIYWGYDSSVTTTTGTRIFKNQFIPLPAGDNISVWVIADAANKKLSIGELA